MNIAVVMGGYSDEKAISIKSGQLIINSLDKNKYTVFEVHILLNDWKVIDKNKEFPINKQDFSVEIDGSTINFDVVINTVHGTPGEDGHLQAYWELINLPYTGCNYYQSSLTFNKRDTLSVLSKFDIPKAKSLYFNISDSLHFQNIVSQLGLPFFVKPNQSGSSLGVSRVNDEKDFQKALDLAFQQDHDILIESYLKGIEVSVGVLFYQNEVKVLGITEIVSENEFFDYEAKYQGKSHEITPARIDENTKILVENTAKKVYQSLGMSGFSRADFIIMDGMPHFIEINTNPGLSPQSIFPQQAKIANLNFSDLLDNEITLALQRKKIWDKF
ncbi:MAG: D-alanine--D-alanine ligase [Flavobacterium sp.]|jgi:D-alanine-D-alanine ligase